MGGTSNRNSFSQHVLFLASIVCLGAALVIYFFTASERTGAHALNILLLSYPMDVESKFVEMLNSANSSIDLEVYLFTNERLAHALADAKARGVNVRVIVGNDEGKEAADVIAILSSAGIPVRIGTNFAVTHAKFAIIDGRIVIIGSHNWTRSAMKTNREVSVVVEDPAIAQKLLAIFEYDWFS